MAAGASRQQLYRAAYRGLKKIQHALATAGVQTVYRRGELVPDKALRDFQRPLTFYIAYTVRRASNGEVAMLPKVWVGAGGQYQRHGLAEGLDLIRRTFPPPPSTPAAV